ncbi:MAG: HAD family hydrolase [Bacillota bacterium]|nr:HAD family hydrolase [Bacillota bacterium]
MIKILVFDLDGTLLLDGTKEIDPRTHISIEKAIKNGMHICIASGRDRIGCKLGSDPLQLEKGNHYLSVLNGRLIYDFQKEEYDISLTMSPEEGYYIQQICKEYNLEAIVCCGYDFYSFVPSNTKAFRKKLLKRYFGKPAEYGFAFKNQPRSYTDLEYEPVLLSHPITKVIFIGKGSFYKQHKKDIERKLEGFSIRMIGPRWLEIMPKGVHKAKSLEKIAQRCGCTLNEVMAFGDGMNDIEMLEAAGIGVAMGNAMKQVKEKANLVTRTNNQNGIGIVIEALLEGRGEELRQAKNIDELF